MDAKTLNTLEYFKILEILAGYAAFGYSAELARNLAPIDDLEAARNRLKRTTEARRLLSIDADISIGGARDIREQLELAKRRGVLEPEELLNVKNTLVSARELSRTILHLEEPYPLLKSIAELMAPPPGIVDIISQTISERGEVMDQASQKLAAIRREMKTSYDRLMSRLEKLINDPKTVTMLQEPIITQRNGRYVIPLRAEFKGRIRSIIHDQSSSGATLFIEPLATVELNNQWHELQLSERNEIHRILAELSEKIGLHAEEIRQSLDTLAELDLVLMCAKYAEDLNAVEPVLLPLQTKGEDHPGSTIRLHKARHPLLDQQKAVPIDVVLDEQTFALIITGPNTGGKTVTLKTVGLLALMAQTGLHIPAQSGSTINVFENIFADIGDEQSIEQSLSTFSGHITNIVRILEEADQNSLVLLDELGAGTDPQEGAALARSLLTFLLDHRITCLVATHYPELKAFAHTTSGVMNASMEFDIKTLQPTYHLTLGLPGRSNALLIAERLGMPQVVLDAARSEINPEDLRAEDLLDEIHHQRNLSRKDRESAELARKEAEKLRNALNTRLEHIEEERIAILEAARLEAQTEIELLQEELKTIRRQMNRSGAPVEDLKTLEEKVEALEADAAPPVERRRKPSQPPPRPLHKGARVHIRSLDMEGRVLAVGETDVEVQLGTLRLRASLSDIQRPGEPVPLPDEKPAARKKAAPEPEATPKKEPVMHPSPGMELDLRGQRVEDGLDALERFLEQAYLAGMPFIRVIHGKGTGRLRQAVQKALRHSQYVSDWSLGKEGEGGDGVTVAHLITD